jgi:hypothetical protein
MKGRSKFTSARNDILGLVVAKLETLLKSDREVFVAGHSLGSVIAFHAINRVVVAERLGTNKPDGFDKLKGFLSFGSPLDKFYYFFRDRDLKRPVRAQIDSALYGLQRASSGRRYGDAEFEEYQPLVPAGFRWWNAWSPTDPLGHRVDFYSPQLQRSFRYGLKGHTGFWNDPDFYEFAVRWLEDENT